jgi:hypothetical protein
VNARRLPKVVRGYLRAGRRRGALARATHRRRRSLTPEGPAAATLLAVYRADNTPMIETLLAQCGGIKLDVRLWALDRPSPSLASVTLGSGKAGKFDLLNRLLAASPCPPSQPVIIADDDVILRRGTLARLLAIVDRARLDLAQPAHESYSFHTHAMTRRRRWSIAQRSTTVEIGPLLVVGPAWRHRILPFPPDLGLGWGLELDWMGLRDEGCRIAMVDDVSIVHLRPIGTAYDQKAEMKRLEDHLRRLGAAGADVQSQMRSLLRREQAWRPWQRRAPW